MDNAAAAPTVMSPIDHRDIDTEPPSLKKVVSSQHHINGTNLYRDTLKSDIQISERSVSPDDTIVSPDAAEKAPIAIVGMGMRLPGGIRTDKDLWDFLVNKQDANGLVPADRFNMDAFYSEQHHPGTAKARNGYYLGEDLAVFDAEFFGISSAELPRMDPRQRLLLEVVWECMESSGQVDWRGKNIGCFVGAFNEDWMELNHRDAQNLGMGSVNSVADFSVPNRISYQYDLTGPSMCVKTACSSSLVALHLAIQALRNGDCESAIVAGTNLIQSPIWTVAISEEGALSPDGNCKTFDASANGYARAEGINAIYIKKLDDALRAKDPIRSIIRGTSVSSDGRTIGFSTPSAASQERLIRATYRQAGIADISETPYVECHGTGTAVGDPTEVQAICDALGTNGTIIGAIKPNLGHAEAASGLSIPFQASRLQVPTEVLPWPANRKERASVNGFGIGGVNAHAILETATSYTQQELPEQTDDESPRLLVISANTMNALRDRLDLLQTYLQNTSHSISDIAYTLGERREHLKFRAYQVMEGKKTLKASDGTKVATEVPKLVFVFTGQGAQWAGMGAELMKSSPQFRASIELMDQALATLPHPPAWTIQEQITSSTSNIDEAEFSQPLTTAFQVGILSTLQAWGVRPDVVVGHSSGEIAAAYAAGSLTMEQAIIAAYYRGVVAKESTRDGCMAALGMGKEAFLPYATAGVTVACENSPESITISGDTQQVENTLARIREAEPGVFCRRLRVKIAYHSGKQA
ncbi:type I Iterative Polyketide synthase (PKS) [Aspergillus brasiliensis]|nr:type I Iterative Polyketide synthase (PKS) [Aspergillus brasiliensis]